eukprot:gene9695-13049_t
MQRPVAQVGQGDSLRDWFNSVPIITKFFLLSTILSGALLSFNIISSSSMVFLWELVRYKFQIWRLLTCFIYAGPFSFNFAMHTYVLYENCRRYELNPFNTGAGGSSADFLWMLLISMVLLLQISIYFEFLVLSEPILYVIMYSWSRRDPTTLVNIFGFKFQAIYLPWAYIGIRLIMGGSIVEPLVGIAVGHIYYFLSQVLPQSHGINLVKTPNFCIKFISFVTGMTQPQQVPTFTPNASAAVGANPSTTGRPNPFPQTGGGYNWGRGRTLGTD